MPEEHNVSTDQIMAALNDPEKLRAVMAAKGLVVQPKVEEKKTGREKPTLAIPEDADMSQLIKALNEFLPKVIDYSSGLAEDKVSVVEGRVKADKDREFRDKIEAFKAKVGKDNFVAAIKIMAPLVDGGNATFEEAYTIAAKHLGLADPFVEGKKKTSSPSSAPINETKPPQVKTSSTVSPTLEKLNEKPPTPREAAAKNLDIILSEMDDGGKSLFGNGD